MNIDMMFPRSLVIEPLRKVPASDPVALVQLFRIVELRVGGKVAHRFMFLELSGQFLENLAVLCDCFIQTLNADLVSCFETLVLESVDVASQQHKIFEQTKGFESAATGPAPLNQTTFPIYFAVL